MKRLLQILAVAVIAVTTFATSSNALATGTCAIGYTGPDSNNICTSETAYSCTVSTDNKIASISDGTQVSLTGNAIIGDNTNAGSARTGSVTNSNNTTLNATVTNAGICSVVATVPGTVTPTVPATVTYTSTPAVTTTPVVAAPKGMGAASSLPNTSGDQTIVYAAGLAGILGIVAVVSRLAVATYSRLKQ